MAVIFFFNQGVSIYLFILIIWLPWVLVAVHGLNYPVAFGILVP